MYLELRKCCKKILDMRGTSFQRKWLNTRRRTHHLSLISRQVASRSTVNLVVRVAGEGKRNNELQIVREDGRPLGRDHEANLPNWSSWFFDIARTILVAESSEEFLLFSKCGSTRSMNDENGDKRTWTGREMERSENLDLEFRPATTN